jgi:hypothetical protein
MKHKILKKDLKEGNIIPIFLNYKEQKDYRGHAILLKRLQEREPLKEQTQFEYHSFISSKGNDIQIIYYWQWWKIKFTTGPEKDFETAVKIAYYQKPYWEKILNRKKVILL